MIGSKGLKEYQERGVVFPFDVLSPQEVNHFVDALHRHVMAARTGAVGSPKLNVTPFDDASHPFAQAILPLTQHRKILHVLREFLGDTILLRSVDIFSKPPLGRRGENVSGATEKGSCYPIQWHWDDPNVEGADGDNVLTAWIALSPSTVQSGCVRYVQGSHRVVLSRDDPGDRSVLHVADNEWDHLQGLPIVDALLEPGQMALHHSAIIHGSAPNLSAQPRMGVALRIHAPEASEGVTGTRVSMLLSGEVSGPVDAQMTEGLQLRDCVPMSWWKKEDSNPEDTKETPSFSRVAAHQALIEELEKGTKEGSPVATYLLARVRLVGMCDTESNSTEALSLFSLAADRGESRAEALREEMEKEKSSAVLQRVREGSKGLSVLAWCVSVNYGEGVSLLLEQGLPVHTRLRDGRQAIHVAADWGAADVLPILVKYGADLTSRTPEGDTPLHRAARAGAVEVLESLVAQGHPLELENKEGKTPLDCVESPEGKTWFSGRSDP